MRLTRLIPLLAFVAALMPLPPAAALDGDPSHSERLGGLTPTDTAVIISEFRFADDGAQHVVLSRDDVFADSLAGTSLTPTGPLLFTTTAALPAVTRDEIARVLPDDGVVYLLGGTNAISQAVEDELAGLGYTVIRRQGPTRVETSIQVAAEARSLYPPGEFNEVLLARAYSPDDNPTAAWADSVTVGAYASFTGTPLVVTPTEAMHPEVDAYLDLVSPDLTTLLGGTAALSDAVLFAAPNPVRVSGPAREDTAVAIAQEMWQQPDLGLRGYVIINGYALDGWATGLVAGTLAGEIRVPLLITHPDVVPEVTQNQIDNCTYANTDLTLVESATSPISLARQSEMDAIDPRPDCGEDADVDGIPDDGDNCVGVFNPRQEEFDGDSEGEMCDSEIGAEADYTLTTAEEVGHEGDPDGEVLARLRVNPADGFICIDWESTTGLETVTGAHIHEGVAGANGDVAVGFSAVPGPTRDAECVSPGADVVTAIFDDPASYYLNVHTVDFPDGAVRSQLA